MLKDQLPEPTFDVNQTSQPHKFGTTSIDLNMAYRVLIEGYLRMQMKDAISQKSNGAADAETTI